MNKIVFLASWYPSRINFLNGDFVERHAKSIALKNDVTVLFVSKDLQLKNSIYDFEFEEKEKVKVYRAFYKEFNSKFLILRKIVSQFRYLKCFHKLFTRAVHTHGKPDFIHLYIPFKAGVYALYLHFFKKYKYIISEQHSYYMPASNGYEKNSFFTKWLIKKIFEKSVAVHTVSKSLGKILIEKNIIKNDFKVIPNVVDTDIFYPIENAKQEAITRYVTITGNVYHKNTDGILRALKKVLSQKENFKLDVIGPATADLKLLAKESGLSDHVFFHGAVTYQNVAQIISCAEAMIFFTRYETFGCVIIEAHACGLPVIASDLPVIRENIAEGFNGIFVRSEDEDALAEKILWYMDHKDNFDKQKIASFTRNKFNYGAVSSQFDQFYKEAFSKKSTTGFVNNHPKTKAKNCFKS
jgi:glycosyltransferase involved in cell wall biosynthesis